MQPYFLLFVLLMLFDAHVGLHIILAEVTRWSEQKCQAAWGWLAGPPGSRERASTLEPVGSNELLFAGDAAAPGMFGRVCAVAFAAALRVTVASLEACSTQQTTTHPWVCTPCKACTFVCHDRP